MTATTHVMFVIEIAGKTEVYEFKKTGNRTYQYGSKSEHRDVYTLSVAECTLPDYTNGVKGHISERRVKTFHGANPVQDFYKMMETVKASVAAKGGELSLVTDLF